MILRASHPDARYIEVFDQDVGVFLRNVFWIDTEKRECEIARKLDGRFVIDDELRVERLRVWGNFVAIDSRTGKPYQSA